MTTKKIYVHVMERSDGTEIRHEYEDEATAQRLARNNRNLGFYSWVEVEEREVEPTVHLQFHGEQQAVEVQDLKPGMVTMWNGGYTKEVAGIRSSKSGKTHQIVYADGSIDSRKMRTGRLVAIA